MVSLVMRLYVATVVAREVLATTPHIREVFLGRCYDFALGRRVNATVNCTEALQMFSNSFASRDPCDVGMDDYEDFLDYVATPVERDKSVFWSGLYPFVNKFTLDGDRYIAIVDTLPGYLADDFDWCGCANVTSATCNDGIEFGRCPSDCARRSSGTSAFGTASFQYWNVASKKFAENVSGVATLMLNATRRPVFRNTSTFAMYELPNLRTDHVTKVMVKLVHAPNSQVTETCESGASLQELRGKLEERGLASECDDDPRDVLHHFCVETPEIAACQFLSAASGLSNSPAFGLSTTFAALLLVAWRTAPDCA